MNYIIEAKKGNQKYYYVIEKNKVLISENIKDAYIFNNAKGAYNTMNNNIPKNLLLIYSFTVIPFQPTLFSNINNTYTPVINQTNKSLLLPNKTRENRKQSIYNNLNNMINNIQNSVEEFKNYKDIINEELSYCDKEINDLHHFIEFNNLSASKGYIIYRDLKKILNQRRELKNTLKIMDEFYCSAASLKKFELKKRIDHYKQNKNHSIYTPRTVETSHLFEKNI